MLEKLQKIGLSKKESELYFQLANLIEATANDIAKETSTNRTVCYNTLQQLVEKGIVTYTKKDNKRMFAIANPESLLVEVREKEDLTKEIIQELNSLRKDRISKRSVEVFEGKKGLKKIFAEIRTCTELRVINATGLLFDALKYAAKHIVEDINTCKTVRIIGTHSMKETQLAKQSNAKIKYLPRKAENYATTFIFDDKIIIQTLKNKPFLVKIEEESIYDGYKKNFDVLWEKL